MISYIVDNERLVLSYSEITCAVIQRQERKPFHFYKGKKFSRDGAHTAIGSKKKEFGIP